MDMHYDNPDFFARVNALEDKSRPGEFNIELIDADTRQTLRVRSRRQVPVNREMINLLNESGLRFRVTDSKGR